MVRLFVRHSVDDYDAWRRTYDEFDNQRGPMGVTGDAVFQSVDDPNDVTLWHGFDTAEAARACFLRRAEDAMQQAVVQGEPKVWFLTPR